MSMTETQKKWKLVVASHRGTIRSRNSTTEDHDSLEACQQAMKSFEQFYENIGYSVRFAKAIGPNGEEVELQKETTNTQGCPKN